MTTRTAFAGASDLLVFSPLIAGSAEAKTFGDPVDLSAYNGAIAVLFIGQLAGTEAAVSVYLQHCDTASEDDGDWEDFSSPLGIYADFVVDGDSAKKVVLQSDECKRFVRFGVDVVSGTTPTATLSCYGLALAG